MPLPDVAGWLIDFRTARAIFSSGSNARISHCVEMCEQSRLYFCHCEEAAFRESDLLRMPFVKDQNCLFEADEDIFKRCITLSQNPLGADRLVGNEAALFLTAIALAQNFGVISNHRSISFSTVYDLCQSYGVPVYSAEEYFTLL